MQKTKLASGEELRPGVTKLERYKDGFPVYGSLSDPRMGSNSMQVRCKTCDCTYAGSGSKMDDCPGIITVDELIGFEVIMPFK